MTTRVFVCVCVCVCGSHAVLGLVSQFIERNLKRNGRKHFLEHSYIYKSQIDEALGLPGIESPNKQNLKHSPVSSLYYQVIKCMNNPSEKGKRNADISMTDCLICSLKLCVPTM